MKILTTLFCAAVYCLPLSAKESPTRITDMECEYLKNPICIDMPAPRLSWRLDDARRGAAQTAYRIEVGSDSAALVRGEADMWDSGVMLCDATNNISYAGKEFSPRTKYFWRVSIWDQNEEKTAPSAIASFETAPWKLSQWEGIWISNGANAESKPSPYFRKEFGVNRSVKSARAYISGLGFYQFTINGQKVGDEFLAPAHTDYNRRIYYQSFDVTPYLKSGVNALGVVLGNSWFNTQSKAVWFFERAPWRNTPRFILDLYVTYDDGTSEVIISDGSWKTTEDGPIRFNNLYSGEYYDARMEMPGWDKPGYDDSSWKNARVENAFIHGELKAQTMQPVRIKQEIKPVSVQKFNDKTYVFDMGENFSGLSKIRVKGERGTTLQLKHAERIFGFNEDPADAEGYIDAANDKRDRTKGRVDMLNIGIHVRFEDSTELIQTDRYTLKGGDYEEWMPLFTYHGYQYLEIVSDKPIELDINSVTGYKLRTDFDHTGTFSCSDQLVNKILDIGLRSYESNFLNVPTDCPQREKNGWTGDAQLACEVGLYNYDPILAYEKFIIDLKDAQKPSGELPGIAPTPGWGYGFGPGPAWDVALFIIPWHMYQYYGDDHLIRSSYPEFKRYMDYLAYRANDHMLDYGLGDWCPYDTKTPVELTSTLYYHRMAELMSLFAGIVGCEKDKAEFALLAGEIKNRINEKYLDPQTGTYANGSQTAQSAALFQGIVPDSLKEKVTAKLVDAVHAGNDHLDVGLLGSKYLLNALTANGQNALAYKVASQPTYPSWGYWITGKNSTTMGEMWNFTESRNHIMFGEICAWMYKALSGINPDTQTVGYKKIVLRPGVDTPLTYAKATTHTVHGNVTCDWEKTGKKLNLTVIVPPNTSAELYLPADARKLYENGTEVKGGDPYIRSVQSASQRITTLASGTYHLELK